MHRNSHCIGLAIVALTLVGCATPSKAPITQKSPHHSTTSSSKVAPNSRASRHSARPSSYTVVRGDTLHSIAWKFGLDHLALARWNKIRNANLIYVGQRLRMTAPVTRSESKSKKLQRSPKQQSKQAGNSVKPTRSIRAVKWRWPADGKIQKASSALGSKGIEIHGKRGSKIVAAGKGQVVYSGSGLRGYGNLIIIKHNDTFLSAYAHNEKILVSEGAKVAPGQAIALMGNSGSKQVMLHFEIRRDGKAVGPLNYLPRR